MKKRWCKWVRKYLSHTVSSNHYNKILGNFPLVCCMVFITTSRSWLGSNYLNAFLLHSHSLCQSQGPVTVLSTKQKEMKNEEYNGLILPPSSYIKLWSSILKCDCIWNQVRPWECNQCGWGPGRGDTEHEHNMWRHGKKVTIKVYSYIFD